MSKSLSIFRHFPSEVFGAGRLRALFAGLYWLPYFPTCMLLMNHLQQCSTLTAGARAALADLRPSAQAITVIVSDALRILGLVLGYINLVNNNSNPELAEP
jgi:hypothetical protein